MKKLIQLSLPLFCLCSLELAAEDAVVEPEGERLPSVKEVISNVATIPEKEIDIVDGLQRMFKQGKVLGQVRMMYSDINYKSSEDVYATAIGGFLKYELAQFKGFNAAVALTTSHDIDSLSGDGAKRNEEFSSASKSYSETTEAYINYNYENVNIRLGRQSIDTPLADSDDIRMVSNSFEAFVVNYESDELLVLVGKLKSWQGYDADLDKPWTPTGVDGTYLGGLTYSGELLDANLWFYNINGEAGDATANNSYYGDVVGHMHLTQEVELHVGAQYLRQDELDNSGVASEIYGASAELVVHGAGFNMAYNKSLKQENKQTFSGFGGGTLFTSMDNMIVDVIAVDRDVDAIVAGLSYTYEDVNFLYAYGDFQGAKDSAGQKEHIVEQNIGFSYEHEEFTFGAIFTQQIDKEETGVNGGDFNNGRVLVAYNF